MTWNWQQADWPHFTWDRDAMARWEDEFLLAGGVLLGMAEHLSEGDWNEVRVESMSEEAVTTSEIEGEMLNRVSVQSSIQRQLGLTADTQNIAPKEQGISELMVTLYGTINEPLTLDVLFAWHRMVLAGRPDVRSVGGFRTSQEPMQVVSGAMYAPKVHFEAPPATAVSSEISRFLAWFDQTRPEGLEPLPPLTRAGIAHLYFESIHPFEDGNGRIGRALSEKALVQGLGRPTLIGLAQGIHARHPSYYEALEAANKRNDVSDWLVWFAEVALAAQQGTTATVQFLIRKTRFLDRLRGKLNDRQLKALLRMLKEGRKGFAGGMSAGKYGIITGASSATATRDLRELVELDALTSAGEWKHTRYSLKL